jgi:hypothetical protein
MQDLYWNTVNKSLKEVLGTLMRASELSSFRLVGGTSLSLQLGHRLSEDIDLFTDATYGSVDFLAIDKFLKKHFPYVDTHGSPVGMGTSYFVGKSEQHAVKLDLYYTDPYIPTTIRKRWNSARDC